MRRLVLAAQTLTISALLAGTAWAQQYPPEVGARRIRRGAPAVDPVDPQVVERGPEALPVTGAELTLIVVVGVAMILLGVALMRRRRRYRPA